MAFTPVGCILEILLFSWWTLNLSSSKSTVCSYFLWSKKEFLPAQTVLSLVKILIACWNHPNLSEFLIPQVFLQVQSFHFFQSSNPQFHSVKRRSRSQALPSLGLQLRGARGALRRGTAGRRGALSPAAGDQGGSGEAGAGHRLQWSLAVGGSFHDIDFLEINHELNGDNGREAKMVISRWFQEQQIGGITVHQQERDYCILTMNVRAYGNFGDMNHELRGDIYVIFMGFSDFSGIFINQSQRLWFKQQEQGNIWFN